MYVVFALLLDDGDVEVPSPQKYGSTGNELLRWFDASSLPYLLVVLCAQPSTPALRLSYLTRCILSQRVYSRLLIRVPRTAIIITSKDLKTCTN